MLTELLFISPQINILLIYNKEAKEKMTNTLNNMDSQYITFGR